MRRLLPIVILLALAAPAAASTAGRHSSAKVTSCAPDTGVTTFSATFTGTMRRYKGAKTLEMRFALYSRSKSAPHWTHTTPVTGFDAWVAANPGVTKYISDKAVHALVPGAYYRALIRYRWRNAGGKVVAHAQHVTSVCHQPDPRPNLKVKKITLRPAGKGMRTYDVKVLNSGQSAAPIFNTGLTVNGIAETDQPTTAELGPGAIAEVTFTAPVCSPGSNLNARADTTNAVDERNESDNTLSIPCPVASNT